MVDDAAFMTRALALAERGRGRTSPNPMVGALIVTPEGVVAGAGFHERAGGPHAEIRALEAAGTRARGATLYCTLEPCCHTGRTGPCAPAIVAAGIVRVVTAIEDPNPRVNGGGIAFLRAHGIEVATGVGREAARRQNEVFFTVMRRGRPFTILKTATSLDGRVAAAPGRRTALTSAAATRHLHTLRAEVDAIAIGSETALVDDPLLTARGVFRDRPLVRVIFDTRLRIPTSNRIWTTLAEGPVMVLTTEEVAAGATDRVAALAAVGATIERLPARDIRVALGRLVERGVTSLLVEGGPTLQAAAWRADVVDRVQVYIADLVIGAAGVPWVADRSLSLAALAARRVEQLGPDVLIEGDVHRDN